MIPCGEQASIPSLFKLYKQKQETFICKYFLVKKRGGEQVPFVSIRRILSFGEPPTLPVPCPSARARLKPAGGRARMPPAPAAQGVWVAAPGDPELRSPELVAGDALAAVAVPPSIPPSPAMVLCPTAAPGNLGPHRLEVSCEVQARGQPGICF